MFVYVCSEDESTKIIARKVADHYSARTNQTLEERETSPIIHLKKLNNWVLIISICVMVCVDLCFLSLARKLPNMCLSGLVFLVSSWVALNDIVLNDFTLCSDLNWTISNSFTEGLLKVILGLLVEGLF